MSLSTKRVPAILLPVLAMAGCATNGVGHGSSRANDVQANFNWQASDDRSGTLSARLSTGETYSGRFFQITADTQVDQIGPLWAGWSDRWHGWRYWDQQPSAAFVTHYSGRVVANLSEPGGQHMRCHFQLVHPSRGMAGGGEGQCQLPSGTVIQATFDHN
jgi:hypothetical protein